MFIMIKTKQDSAALKSYQELLQKVKILWENYNISNST